MARDRVLGQDVHLTFVYKGQPVVQLTNIKNCDLDIEMELLREQYLGKMSDSFDDVFKGVTGKMDVHYGTKQVFQLFQSLVQRAKFRDPSSIFNMTMAINMPDGDRVKILVPNLFFGAFPINVGGRTQYVTTAMSYGGDDFKATFA